MTQLTDEQIDTLHMGLVTDLNRVAYRIKHESNSKENEREHCEALAVYINTCIDLGYLDPRKHIMTAHDVHRRLALTLSCAQWTLLVEGMVNNLHEAYKLLTGVTIPTDDDPNILNRYGYTMRPSNVYKAYLKNATPATTKAVRNLALASLIDANL